MRPDEVIIGAPPFDLALHADHAVGGGPGATGEGGDTLAGGQVQALDEGGLQRARPAQEAQGGPGMWMYLDLASVEDLAALYQEYLEKAVKIPEPPTDKPWGMREMLIEDVDGHTLRIGAPRTHE